MRESKFRGKRLDNGAWEYGDLVQFGQKCHTPCKCAIIPGTASGSDPLCKVLLDYEVDPDTVGQYTGLKDKNGKEIYEGDIISDGRQFNVKWDSRGACWTGEMHNDPQQQLDLAFLITHKQTRIIGNIHDNPELLE